MRKLAESYPPLTLRGMFDAQAILREDISNVKQIVGKVDRLSRKETESILKADPNADEDPFLNAVPLLLSWSRQFVLMDKVSM